MFRPRPDRASGTIAVEVERRVVRVPEGASAAAAMLMAGLPSIRETPVAGNARLPYCMMGICFDCLAEIDGEPNRQACMVGARPGMRIRRQCGARAIDPDAAPDPPAFAVPEPRSGGA
ncbi:MAG TPA: 2Fe-2S iron-sulfur cluster-binding protein [Stellaceae bacterium]